MIFILIISLILLGGTLILFLLEIRKRRQVQGILKSVRKQKQKETRMFDTLLNNVHACILLVDETLTVHKTNYYKQSGKPESWEAKKLGELLTCTNAVQYGSCGGGVECGKCILRHTALKAFANKKGFSDMEAELTVATAEDKRLNGQFLVSGEYLEIDNSKYLLITMQNATELIATKNAARKLQRAISLASAVSQVGFAVLEIGGDEEEIITPEYCKNLCEKEEERVEEIMTKFKNVHPEDREELLLFIETCNTEDARTLCKDVRVKIGEDAWKWIKIFLVQEEGHPNKIYSLSIDVSERKKEEENLVIQKEKAIEADLSKSAFLANMSHEIRTPLNAIVGFSELLASADTEDEKEQYLQILKMNTDMLLQLINDILDMSKIEAGTIDFSFSEVEVSGMMKDIERLFAMKIGEGGPVEIIYEPSVEPCMIRTDRNRLVQVISNFMTNAIKFTEKGSIRLGYKPCKEGVYFYVSDTGLGIPKEKQKEVFGRFSRFHKQKKGNGLGLSISRSIVTKLGGEIGFDSIHMQGSTFWFTLPVDSKMTSVLLDRKKETVAVEEEVAVEDVDEVKKVASDMRTILIAESQEESYHLYEAFLEKNYKLLWARNGEEAISLFLLHEPNLILMDLHMPIVDGYEATAAIRQLSADIPIIALIASENEDDEKKAANGGFTNHLPKSAPSEVLLEKIKTYCG